MEIGFKHYGPRVRLYCKTGHCLTILSDGNVTGDRHGVHKSGVNTFLVLLFLHFKIILKTFEYIKK